MYFKYDYSAFFSSSECLGKYQARFDSLRARLLQLCVAGLASSETEDVFPGGTLGQSAHVYHMYTCIHG